VTNPQATSFSPRGYRALLRNPPYRTLLCSSMLIHFGFGLYLTVLPWLVLEVTGSKSAVGWATTARFLPYLLLSIPLGTLVDRFDRRRVMIASNWISALLAAAVPVLHLAGALRGWHVLVTAFLLSTFGLPIYLARVAALPQIVAKDNIVTANSASMVLLGLSLMGGTALIGPVVDTLGLANSFSIYAAVLVVSALVLTRLELPARTGQERAEDGLGPRDLLQGISYVLSDPVVRAVFLLDALYFGLANGMVMTGMPLFVRDVLGGGPEVHGRILVLGNVGMLFGSLWLGRFGRHLPKGRVITVCWMGYGLALLCQTLFSTLEPVLVASFFVGMIGNLIPVTASSLLQEQVPPELLGRVFGVWNMIAPGWGSFSGGIAGTLARTLPATGLIALGAAISCGNAMLARLSKLWHQE